MREVPKHTLPFVLEFNLVAWALHVSIPQIPAGGPLCAEPYGRDTLSGRAPRA